MRYEIKHNFLRAWKLEILNLSLAILKSKKWDNFSQKAVQVPGLSVFGVNLARGSGSAFPPCTHPVTMNK